MKTIVVGLGEVGEGMREVLSKVYSVSICDPSKEHIPALEERYDVMIVALPWSDQFIGFTKLYQKIWNPRYTVVVSTVPVGTCRKVNAWHSPVEGIHPRLAESLLTHVRWLGGVPDPVLISYFEQVGMKVKSVEKPEETEFLKLRSTTLYGINIEYARYSGQVCEQMGFDYENVNEWDAHYNELYDTLGLSQMKRYLLKPPSGKIGGHCIYPNAQILQGQFPDEMIDVILRRNGAEAWGSHEIDDRPYNPDPSNS